MDGMLLLGLGLGAFGWMGAAPEPDAPPVDRRTLSAEESWRPRPSIRLEDDGVRLSFRLPSLVLDAAGYRRDDPEWLRRPAEEPAPRSDESFRFGPHPWDVVVSVEKPVGSWGTGISGVSVATELPGTLIPLAAGISVGGNVDLLGFEEYEGTTLTLIDRRHGNPRLSNLSTGVGLTIKF